MIVDCRAVWRWHFYAGLFCIPFVVLLAVTGSIYLFKPQIDAWSDHAYDARASPAPATAADTQVRAALDYVPGSRLDAYELPAASQGVARVILRDSSGRKLRVFVDRSTARVLGSVYEDRRASQVVKTLHGELLMGSAGSLVVELAASWAIVMIVTGLYLWWPRNTRGAAGVFYPRLRSGSRTFWRDLHAVTGLWVSFMALFLLLTALPWTGVWGEAFKELRRVSGTAAERQDWTQSRAAEMNGHHAHDSSDFRATASAMMSPTVLDDVIRQVTPLDWAPPVLISPPTGTRRTWIVRSDSQNRPLRQSLTLDSTGSTVLARESFADRQLIDRVIGVGIAAHEGQLFAPLNQVLGVLTAAGLITLCVSAVVMWWRRRPMGSLGAPAPTPGAKGTAGLASVVIGFGVLLPVLGMSLVAIALVDQLLLRRFGHVRRWLGLPAPE